MTPETHGKVRLLAFLIPAFFLVFFGFGSGAIRHFAADLRENDRYCYANNEAEKHQSEKECKSFLYRAYEDPVALFTLVLMVATVGLFVATFFLWRATRDLVRGADKTAERQLRPYVVLKPFSHTFDVDELTGNVAQWHFRCVWHNVGSMPTKHMITKVGMITSITIEQLNFENNVHLLNESVPGRCFLGPGSEMGSEKFTVFVQNMLMVPRDMYHVYIWGGADYDDALNGSERHRTEIFAEIYFVGDVRSRDCKIGYRAHGPFNGMDDECYGKPEPYDPKLFG